MSVTSVHVGWGRRRRRGRRLGNGRWFVRRNARSPLCQVIRCLHQASGTKIFRSVGIGCGGVGGRILNRQKESWIAAILSCEHLRRIDREHPNELARVERRPSDEGPIQESGATVGSDRDPQELAGSVLGLEGRDPWVRIGKARVGPIRDSRLGRVGEQHRFGVHAGRHRPNLGAGIIVGVASLSARFAAGVIDRAMRLVEEKEGRIWHESRREVDDVVLVGGEEHFGRRCSTSSRLCESTRSRSRRASASCSAFLRW